MVDTCRRWLHLPEPGALYALLGTIAANRLEGDPVWLLLVGPPGGGKTELLNALSGLEDVHPTATLTEAALLSGTSKRERAQEAKGGLLRTIGDFGIIVAKDFGSVLSMNRDARALVMAALREIYDGSWTRHVGTDGGRTMSWSGKVGFVGGCTQTIDRHHAVMGAMGERFLFYRLPEIDSSMQATRALTHAGKERVMRAELAANVSGVLSGITPTSVELSAAETTWLVDLATLVARGRSAVERDSYSREIELVPDPEAPTRLVVMLARLLQGLCAIGLDRQEAHEVVVKTALDSMPTLRRKLLVELFHATGERMDTTELGQATLHPTTTTKRSLEDLTAHRLVERHPQGEGKPHEWCLTEFATVRLARFVGEGTRPEMLVQVPETAKQSGTDYTYSSSLRADDDISGRVGPADNGSAHERPPLFDDVPEAVGVAADDDDGIPF
jgi:energy-coupling factor transporter ATP-binding protein EcfA2